MNMKSCLPLLLTLLLNTSVWAEQRIFVQGTASIDGRINIPDGVENKCQPLDKLVGTGVLNHIRAKFPQAQPLENGETTGDDLVLSLTITGLMAPGGAGWTGNKSITIRADLRQRGDLILSTQRISSGRGGLLGPVASTCGILEDIADDAGENIAKWFSTYMADPLAAIAVRDSGSALALLMPAVIDSSASVPDAVMRECAIDTTLANHTMQRLLKRYPGIVGVNDLRQASGRAISLTITNVVAPPGGSASGAKSMTISVNLWKNNEVIAHFENTREGGHGSIFGTQVFRSACSILEGVSNALAADVAKWMLKTDQAARLAPPSTEPMTDPDSGQAAAQ